MGNIMDDWFGFDPPKPPKPADPMQTAETQQRFAAEQAALQAGYNLDALRTNISANRLDQDTPFASLRYIQTGVDPYGNPTYGAQTQLTDDQQAILDQLEQNQQAIGGTAGNLIQSTSGMYGSPLDLTDVPNFTEGADSVVSQAMDRQLAYLQPYHTQALERAHTELVNRGLTPGNPAYDAEMRRIRQSQSESVGQFLNQFQPLAFNQQLQQYQEKIKQELEEYGRPLDTIRNLMGMTSPNANAGFVTPPTTNLGSPNVGAVDFAGIQNQVQQALNEVYKMQLGQHNAQMNAIGSGIGTVLGAPAGTLFGGVTGGVGAGLGNLLGLNPGNASSMRLF